jgi:hypothetical protein
MGRGTSSAQTSTVQTRACASQPSTPVRLVAMATQRPAPVGCLGVDYLSRTFLVRLPMGCGEACAISGRAALGLAAKDRTGKRGSLVHCIDRSAVSGLGKKKIGLIRTRAGKRWVLSPHCAGPRSDRGEYRGLRHDPTLGACPVLQRHPPQRNCLEYVESSRVC